jgi:ankyrin repeat protein
MSRSPKRRALTPKTSFEQLRKEAKRWLKALRARDPDARVRLQAAWPKAPVEPALRDVQHALAREYGQDSWIVLKAALAELALARRSVEERAEIVLRNGWGGDLPAARRLLARDPGLAQTSFFAAAACGDLDAVERGLARDPDAARKTGGPLNWTALAYVAYGRLDEVNGVAIARRLLEAGADPNFQFDDGWGSPFKVLTGAIGLGEGAKPSHPQAVELVELLIGAGAASYDLQALYNVSIVGDDLDWYGRLWRYGETAGVLDQWSVPGDGRLGGAKGVSTLDYLLGNAIGQNHLARAEWLLARGADPDGPNFYSGQPLNVAARLSGFLEMTDLLERHGAGLAALTGLHAFQAACMAADRAEAEALLATDPSLIGKPQPLLSAAELGNDKAVDLLLSLGARPGALDHQGISPLHRAVQSGKVDMVRRLVEAGAKVDLRERRWHGTPMSWAVVLGQPEVADFLAPLSYDVRPFVAQGRLERLEAALTEQPWRANERLAGDCPTALYCLPDDEEAACEAARMLLAHGADPGVRNAKGQTPADWARLKGLDDAADLIEAHMNSALFSRN